MSNPEIAKMLTISTGHVSRETAAKLEHGGACFLSIFAKGEYGWFIFVARDDDSMGGAPPDLAACIAKARALGCDWLCLDRDGDELDGLPVYDWEG